METTSAFGLREGGGLGLEPTQDSQPKANKVASVRQRKESARHQLVVNSTWYREKGNKAFKKRDYDVAYALYTKGIRHMPTSMLFCNRSIANLRRGRAKDAFLDASLAMKLQPNNIKAYVRRAAALQKLGKLKEAQADLEKACTFGNDKFVMKMLEDVRVCLSRVEENQATTACSSKSPKQQQRLASAANNASQTGSVKQAVEEILDILELATAEGQPMQMQIDSSRVSSELSNLQALLESESDLESADECVDYFFACSGVSKVFSVFHYDNLKVLRIIRQVCGAASPSSPGSGSSRTVEGRIRARAHKIMFLNEATSWHFGILLDCVLNRKVAIVGGALDILNIFLARKEFKDEFLESKEAAESSKVVSMVLTMFAKASKDLSVKSGRIIERVANLKKFVSYAVEHHQLLVQGLARCCTSKEDTPKGLALSILEKMQHSKAVLSMLSVKDVASGLSNLILDAVSSQLEGKQVFVSAAFTREQLAQLTCILNICASLCISNRSSRGAQSISKDFVAELGDKGMWVLVIQMIESQCYTVRMAAITLFVSACRCVPELAYSIIRDQGIFQTFFDIFANTEEPKCQEEVSYIANLLCNIPDFHQLLSTRYPLGQLLKIAQSNSSDITIVALCRILLCVSKNDEDFQDKLCTDSDFLKILVQLWYSRQQTAKFYALQLLQHLLSEEKASMVLTESASEGQIRVLIEDLAKHKVMMEAYETGGASLFSQAVDDMLVVERSRLVDQLDSAKLCTYLETLLGPAEENRVVVEVCSASGMLCTQIAQAMGPATSVYAVDWCKSLVARVEHLASQTKTSNVYSKLCDYETLDQLPVRSNLTLLAGVWQSLEDPPQLFESIKRKLAKGGKIVLVEELKECFEDAKYWLKKSGFAIFAEPKHITPGVHVGVFLL
jgi:precorrin-6B methylase 2